jgi:CheY-like chemotaxis protein
VAPAGRAPAGQEVAAERVARPRIWIIDDDAWMRSLLKAMLEEEGYALWDTGDASQAIERFTSASTTERPDVILTDVIMPVMTGMRMIDQIAKISPDLRVIYMSGYVQSVIDWQGPPASVVTFLGKPIARDVLREAVQTMLRTPTGSAPDLPPG